MTDPQVGTEQHRQRWLRESRAIIEDESDRRSLGRRRIVLLIVVAILSGYVLACAVIIAQLT